MRWAFVLLVFLAGVTSPICAKPLGEPEEAKVFMTDGFDYPVAKPDATGYFKFRGWFKYHPGEDWVCANRAVLLGAPVYAIGRGMVVFTRNAPGGWGNVVIVRHAYYDGHQTQYVDSFYAHLNRVIVQEGQLVLKGQQVGEVGTNRGMYHPHLHLEIRKNLLIGIDRAGYARNFNNYWIPTQFIEANRKLKRGGHIVSIPINTIKFQTEFPFPIDESQLRERKKTPLKKKTESRPAIKRTFRVDRFEDLHSL